MLYFDNDVYSSTDVYFKVMLYIICYSFRCEIRVTLMLCSSSSSILIFLSYLFSPSNFFLLMIWNVRCLNGQHGSLMLIFGVENPSSLQWYQSWRLSKYLGSVAWLSRDGVSNTLDWVWVYIYEWTYLLFDIKFVLYCGDLLVELFMSSGRSVWSTVSVGVL